MPATLDTDTVARLLDFEPRTPLEIRDKAMLELFYSSGLRLSELATLHWDQLDTSSGLLRVTGKGNKTRVVPLGSYAAAALAARHPALPDAPRAPRALAAVRRRLQAVLAGQSATYGLPPARASAIIALMVLDYYLSGAYYPRGGSGALRDALVDAWSAGMAFEIADAAVEVIVGDANATLPGWDGRADAWFLDGFAPARKTGRPCLLRSVGQTQRSGQGCRAL